MCKVLLVCLFVMCKTHSIRLRFTIVHQMLSSDYRLLYVCRSYVRRLHLKYTKSAFLIRTMYKWNSPMCCGFQANRIQCVFKLKVTYVEIENVTTTRNEYVCLWLTALQRWYQLFMIFFGQFYILFDKNSNFQCSETFFLSIKLKEFFFCSFHVIEGNLLLCLF